MNHSTVGLAILCLIAVFGVGAFLFDFLSALWAGRRKRD